MPEIDASVSKGAVENIRHAADLIGKDQPSLQSIHICLSIGLASFPADGENSEALLKVADQRLYRSKQSSPHES